jgi:enamine deaminase RidA (YjgF/YER057c/UK114 family)
MSSNKPYAFNPPDVPTPPPTYDQVCITPILPTSKLITLAGQTGLRSDQSISPDIKQQAKDAYQAVHNCLKAAGATPRDIVRCSEFSTVEAQHADLIPDTCTALHRERVRCIYSVTRNRF